MSTKSTYIPRATKLRTCFSDDDVFWLEEFPDARPEPGMRYDIVILVRHRGDEPRDFDLLGVGAEGGQALSEFWNKLLHPDCWERGILHLGVIGMEL